MSSVNLEQVAWRLDNLERERLVSIEMRKADKTDVAIETERRVAADKRLEDMVVDIKGDIEDIKAGTRRVLWLAGSTLLTVVGAIFVAFATKGF
jgi:hypothetical protein